MQRRVLLIYTGGTIAGNVSISNVTENTKHEPDAFLKILEDAKDVIFRNWNVEIVSEAVEACSVDSSNMQPENWTSIINIIENRYDDFDSFIVLHGTNTMAYTSAALTFAFENINKPVIFTGAQVPLGFLGSDSTTNLINALRLAVWSYHEVKGILTVFGSKIITGPRLKKGTDFDYDPFKSFQTGALGEIGRFVRIDESALSKHVKYLSKRKPLAIQKRLLSVKDTFRMNEIISLTELPGMKNEFFQTLVENNGVKGFVLRSYGAGDPSVNLYPSLEYLKNNKIPIVITTQAPEGVSNFLVNETGQYLAENDLAIPAHDMSIEAMTVKLGWLLGQNKSYDEIKTGMLEDFHGEIHIESELI